MKFYFVILFIIAQVGLVQADTSFCSCSDFKQASECYFNIGECDWDRTALQCSETTCATRFSCTSYYRVSLTLANTCVMYLSKCQDIKATCAEYTSETELDRLDCPEATEGNCEVDTAEQSKKCKKSAPSPDALCKEFIYAFLCNSVTQSTPDRTRYCYFDNSKSGSDADPKCLYKPLDCSGTIEAACDVQGCTWKDSKCQLTTCEFLSESECEGFKTNAGGFQFCQLEGSTCSAMNPSTLPANRCHIRTLSFYHFTQSCKLCSASEETETNSDGTTSEFSGANDSGGSGTTSGDNDETGTTSESSGANDSGGNGTTSGHNEETDSASGSEGTGTTSQSGGANVPEATDSIGSDSDTNDTSGSNSTNDTITNANGLTLGCGIISLMAILMN